MTLAKALIIVIHAFTGWALCGAVIGIGKSVTSIQATLVIHAIAAPLIFFVLSMIYFKKFSYTKPLATAIIFTGFVMIMDAGLVAPVFEKSYDMFRSLIGTWIPFALIFISTYLTGLYLKNTKAKI